MGKVVGPRQREQRAEQAQRQSDVARGRRFAAGAKASHAIRGCLSRGRLSHPAPPKWSCRPGVSPPKSRKSITMQPNNNYMSTDSTRGSAQVRHMGDTANNATVGSAPPHQQFNPAEPAIASSGNVQPAARRFRMAQELSDGYGHDGGAANQYGAAMAQQQLA